MLSGYKDASDSDRSECRNSCEFFYTQWEADRQIEGYLDSRVG